MRKHYDLPHFIAPTRDGLGDKAYLDIMLQCFYTESEARKWWNLSLLKLNGKTPNEVWEVDHDRVIKLVEEAYVNWQLEGSYNSFGIMRWWQRERAQLEGMKPIDVWETDRNKVIRLAEGLSGNMIIT